MDTHTTKQAVFRRRRVAPTPLARPTVLLIRGCPRTGTTIVAAMINASLEAAVVYEYAIDALTRDLRVLLAYEEETVRRWNLAPEGFALTDAQREGAYFNDYGDPQTLSGRRVASARGGRGLELTGLSTDVRPLGLYLHGLQLNAHPAGRRPAAKRVTANGHL